MHPKRVRRAIRRRVLIRIEEWGSRASPCVAKVQAWRGAGGYAPAIDRGAAALEGEPRVEDAVFEGIVACYGWLARELEEVHADEDYDEAGEEGHGVHWIVRVDALEEDEGRDDGGRREADVI